MQPQPSQNPPELSESLARIVEEAQAVHRPRQLFGVTLGARPATSPVAHQAQPTPVSRPQSAPREPLSRARVDSFKQCYQMILEQLMARGTVNHPWALAYHTQTVDGTLGLLDALETNLMRGGVQKIKNWLNEMTRTPDASTALSSILVAAAEAAPERIVGIMLLTTDHVGEGAVVSGVECLRSVIVKLSQGLECSLRLAHFLALCSRHPRAGRGLAELLEVLAAPEEDEWGGVAPLCQAFCDISSTVGGSRRLAQMLENLCEVDNGRLTVGRWLNRLTRTPEGIRSTLGWLRNLSSDKEGASQLSLILARLANSRGSAGELLSALQNMAVDSQSRRELANWWVDLSEGSDTARMLANLCQDAYLTCRLQYFFDLLAGDPRCRKRLVYTLDRLANCPRQAHFYREFEVRLQRLQSHSLAV